MKIFTFFICLALVACGGNTENSRLIIGKWVGIEWLVEGAPSNLNAVGTSFSFDENGNYTYEYIGASEAGTYKVENDMLFTKKQEGSEIMVKIAKLNQDSLVFTMNRGGRSEQLTLLRNK